LPLAAVIGGKCIQRYIWLFEDWQYMEALSMDFSLILDLITAVAVVTGILFGLLQLRHYHLSRQREADLFLLNSFHTGEFLHGIGHLQEFPNGLTKKEIDQHFGQDIRLVYVVLSTWERIGMLVFNREISFDMVEEAYGELLIISWHGLEKYVAEIREELQRERLFEWFQWLAERMLDRERSQTREPVYVGYRNWT
jgi:hypothetical protein